MPKTLIIAEKPSVARDIARVLFCKTRLEGALASDTHIVSWAIGHLVTLKEPDEIDPIYKKWRMDTLPILPPSMLTKVIPQTKSQYSILKSYLTSPDIASVICATDSGREGELIFRYIYNEARCNKPIQRLWISSMTDSAIKSGLNSMRPDSDYEPLYQSARCRAEADWLVGMNATRAFTLRYDALLTLGRVQTPTLNLIVQRDLEIDQFIPTPYHEARADFGDYQGLYLDTEKNELRCYDPELAKLIKSECTGKHGKVTKSTSEHKRIPPPQLFDLTTLQREANQKHGLSAQKTLQIAQALYEQHKLITYPRTDSRYLTGDMAPKIKQVMRAMPAPYAELAQPVQDVSVPFGRVINDQKVSDHHAIVPTGQFAAMPKLTPDERKLFDMIARRLIAVHYPDYEYQSQTVITEVSGYPFKTTGAAPIAAGWKDVYKADGAPDEKDKTEQPVPKLIEGDERKCESVTLKLMKTKPPQPLTDASLLQMMERAGKLVDDESIQEALKDSGLGTPATRAAIIERLIQVKYVARKGKALISTEKGRKLICVVPEELRSAETTGKWERALSGMAREKDEVALRRRADKFMASIGRYATFLVESAKSAPGDVKFEREPFHKKKAPQR